MRVLYAALMVAGVATMPASADPVTIMSAGAWTVSDDGGSLADIATGPHGIAALILPAGSHHFALRIARAEWHFSPDTTATVKVTFDNGAAFSLAGFGSGQTIEAALADADMKAWTHDFTALSNMTIAVANAPGEPWTLSLAGSTPTVEAMAHQIELAGITGLPAPWNPQAADLTPPVPLPTPQPAVLPYAPAPHPDCFPRGPVAINGWLSQDAALQQQRACEQAYALQDAQRHAQEVANARAAALAAQRVRDEAVAEESPENRCRQPEFARQLLDSFNDFDRFKDLDMKAIDIEHLRTVNWDDSLKYYACHGTFVLTNGRKMTGLLTIKPNVAGDLIDTWVADQD